MAEQNTQALVLQQPNGEKLQFELKITQVADDTTAMKSFEKGADISIASFDSSAYIAVFLALFATGLAYWFGARSFVLTKQSFDSLIEQIKSSENGMRETNKQLIDSQKQLKRMDIVIEKNNAIRLISAEFISLCESLIYEAESLRINFGIKLPESYLFELTQKRDLMENLGTRLELYLGNSHIRGNILLLKTGIIRIIRPLLNGENKNPDIEYWLKEVKNFKKELFEYLENELDLVGKEGE